jgi:hypothetical protein
MPTTSGANRLRSLRTVTDVERRARIAVRHALGAPVADPRSAAEAMTCLHGTEPATIYLAAFARCGATRAEVADTLYSSRTVIRQLAMRRTVFAFPRDLLPAALGSASARVAKQLTARLAKEVELAGVTRDGPAWVANVCERTLDAIRDSPGTTTQLRSRVADLNAQIVRPGQPELPVPVAARLLTVLAASGQVVRGDNPGNWQLSRPVWTAMEQWLGAPPPVVDEQAGYGELVRCWLWSFGPGTEDDLVWWLGATRSAVRHALHAIGAAPVRLEDGSAAWLHPDDTEAVTAPGEWAALLPALDPTTMGWRGREFYLADHARLLFDRNGNAGPTAWWNGRVVGSWTQGPGGRVTVVPIGDLPRAAATALAAKAAELTAWLDGDMVRTIYRAPLVQSR